MANAYRLIQGWFDYQKVYDREIGRLLKRSGHKPRVVEIGAWLGKSSHYLVGKHGSTTEIYIVDTWKGTPDELETSHKLATEKDIFIDFLDNMEIYRGKFMPIQLQSTEAAALFKDQSLDFIFIDANHSYSEVKADLEAWFPKLAPGGTIAGHDYVDWKGVNKAVDEFFGYHHIKTAYRSWIYEGKRSPLTIAIKSPVYYVYRKMSLAAHILRRKFHQVTQAFNTAIY